MGNKPILLAQGGKSQVAFGSPQGTLASSWRNARWGAVGKSGNEGSLDTPELFIETFNYSPLFYLNNKHISFNNI
jgi:hypothetical protein